jgi:hypothetical protein
MPLPPPDTPSSFDVSGKAKAKMFVLKLLACSQAKNVSRAARHTPGTDASQLRATALQCLYFSLSPDIDSHLAFMFLSSQAALSYSFCSTCLLFF